MRLDVVACPNQKFWELFVHALGEPSWAADPCFATIAARSEHKAELLAAVEPVMRGHTTAEWVALLTASGVPCAPIRSIDEVFDEPQVAARDLVVTVPHPTWGAVQQVRTAVRVGAPRDRHEPAPALGADTVTVLREVCGYGDDEIAVVVDAE